MIYDFYNEGATASLDNVNVPDYLAECEDYGLSVPSNGSSYEQNMYLAGIAEAAMLTAFDRINVCESTYFDEGYVTESSVILDSIKGVFGRMHEAIKKAFAKAIEWIQEKVEEVKKKFREWDLDRILKKMDESALNSKGADASKVIYKSSIVVFGDTGKKKGLISAITGAIAHKSGKAAPFDFVETMRRVGAQASSIAGGVLTGKKTYSTSNELKLTAANLMYGKMVDGKITSVSDIHKKVKSAAIRNEKVEITVGDAKGHITELKDLVLAGSQKFELKKAYESEKKAINVMIKDAKTSASKDDTTIKSKVAQAKDVIMIMDIGYKVLIEAAKTQYVEARSILIALAKYSHSVSKTNEKAANESSYLW